MEKLTIEHLAPYLPYSLRLRVPEIHDKFECRLVISNNTVSMLGGLNISEAISHNAKPVLRPLSDLTKPIAVEGYNDWKEFYPLKELTANEQDRKRIHHYGVRKILLGELADAYDKTGRVILPVWISNVGLNRYEVVKMLYRWHFDVFGLHSKGLCIYYNELK